MDGLTLRSQVSFVLRSRMENARTVQFRALDRTLASPRHPAERTGQGGPLKRQRGGARREEEARSREVSDTQVQVVASNPYRA